MSQQLDGLEPGLLWKRFFELTSIARPSKEEGKVREHVLAWAAARDFDASADEAGNVVVRAPASPGREQAATVVLQSHLDMVCERDPTSPFDPREGRIDVRVDGDWVTADATTLGADNGIGVAAAMAVGDDTSIEHGPLELLFTVSEEQGLEGAKALDPSIVSGRLLINLDGTSDGALTVGCAGSDHTVLRLPLRSVPLPSDHVVLRVGLSGAKGGHSGADIGNGRANAIKVLGRTLSAAYEATAFGLVSIEGGVSRNAIPREARALVTLPAMTEAAFRTSAAVELESIGGRYAETDDDLALSIDRSAAARVADAATSRRALDLVEAIPTGVIAIAPGFAETVETSTSLTVASTLKGVVELASMTRSSNASALDDVLASMQAIARLGGGEIEVRRSYPPWEPRLDSPLLASAERSFRRLFDASPARAVVHGGLECAVLGQKLPGVEMISIGPEIVGAHAPGEMVRISSTQRFYRLLGALLDELSR
jgi:dipeptidase D